MAWSGACAKPNSHVAGFRRRLLDDKLRLHLGKRRDAPPQPVARAIDELRNDLNQPGKLVRLVGLSGVGKTRLVQALFDRRIGSSPLPSSLAVYANMADNPDPQPMGLASDLIANRRRAVLIVDNCASDLHRRLSELCGGHDSTLSVITVEYDVRDDQPESTQVVTLDRAVSAYETYWSRHQDLLKSLLELQAGAVLDVLFAGDEGEQRAATHAFDESSNLRGNPADGISFEMLVAWCERDRRNRYPLAASIITFARAPDGGGPREWTQQAKALLAGAPDRKNVLAAFIGRFQPMSWMGSRAALLEAHAGLLDRWDPQITSDLRAFVADAKVRLAAEVARQREREREEDRTQDERFE